MTAPIPPPDWYPDPSGAPTQRYWDGYKWGDYKYTGESVRQLLSPR